MKLNWLFLGLFVFLMNCDPNDDPPLPENTIQISNQNWEISKKNALVLGYPEPKVGNIYLKMDGTDGSFLYLVIPDSVFYKDLEAPYTTLGMVEFYASGSLDTKEFTGEATIDIANFDFDTKTLQLHFEATAERNGETISIQSGDLSGFELGAVHTSTVSPEYQFMANQSNWLASESGADMVGGKVSWFFFNPYVSLEEQAYISFELPWGLSLGTYNLSTNESGRLKYFHGNNMVEWVLESGQIILERNDFATPKQKGTLNAVFHHPDDVTQKFQIESASFSAGFLY